MSESTNESTSFIKTCYVLDDQAEMVVSFPASESMAVHILALIFMAILIFTTVCLNGVTAFTIWRSKTLKEKPANFTIMLQSNCVVMYVLKKLGMLFFFYTLTTLSVMNFDRYMGVLHPFVRRTLVTNKRILRYVVAASSIQTVIYAFSLTHNEIIRPILITITLSFILMTVFVYLKIFLKIRETNKVRVTLVEEGCESGVENRPRSTSLKNLAKSRVGKASFLKELKAAKSSFLVVICCLVCCLPGAISFGPLNLKSSFKAIAIKIFFVVLAMLNSSLNSVIYFWQNNMLRKQGKDVIKRMFSRSTAT